MNDKLQQLNRLNGKWVNVWYYFDDITSERMCTYGHLRMNCNGTVSVKNYDDAGSEFAYFRIDRISVINEEYAEIYLHKDIYVE